jgi:hypothetical protein
MSSDCVVSGQTTVLLLAAADNIFLVPPKTSILLLPNYCIHVRIKW